MKQCVRLSVAALVAVLGFPLAAHSQAAASDGEPAFLLGPLEWTPSVAFRDVGVDSNIFDTPSAHQSDFTWTLSPQVRARLDTPRLKLDGASLVDVVYFDRYVSERSINRRFNSRLEIPLNVLTPFASGAYEHVRDRENGEIDVRATRQSTTGSLGVRLQVASRAAVELSGRVEDHSYADGQTVRGVALGDALDRRVEAGHVGLRFELTPLTTFIADAAYTRDQYNVARTLNQRNRQAVAGFEFSPDAVIRGRATMGYRSLTFDGEHETPYDGITADVDLSYVLLGVTRFDARYLRDTMHSIEAPYYLQTLAGLSILQTLAGPFELTARGARDTMDYPGTLRTDHTDTLGGGVGIRLSRLTRVTFNYELVRRRSALESLRYERRRLFTSVLVGF